LADGMVLLSKVTDDSRSSRKWLTVFFADGSELASLPGLTKIDRSLSIVVETSPNSNRAIFSLKSNA
jgi:hypothetical protein